MINAVYDGYYYFLAQITCQPVYMTIELNHHSSCFMWNGLVHGFDVFYLNVIQDNYILDIYKPVS